MDRNEETQEDRNKRYMNNAELIFIFLIGWVLAVVTSLVILNIYL